MIGSIIAYAGSTAPNGWLLCDGATLQRSEYSKLFDVIGTTYGVGDGLRTFDIPDLQGRALFGVNNPSLEGDEDGARDTQIIGDSGGAETHTLVESELPPHTHTTQQLPAGGNNPGVGGQSTVTSTTTDQTGSTGGDMPHENMNPYRVLNWIIKYK